MKCLEKRPNDRYSSARALADDIDRVLIGGRPQAGPVPSVRRAVRAAGRAAWVLLGIFTLIGALTVGGVYFYESQQPRTQTRKTMNEAFDLLRMAISQLEDDSQASPPPKQYKEAIAKLRDVRQQVDLNQKLGLGIQEEIAVFLGLGRAHEDIGDLEQALINYDEAIKRIETTGEPWTDPASPYRWRGFVQFQNKQYAKAAKDFRQARHLAPDRADAHYHLAITEWHLGQNNDAAQGIEKAIDLDPTNETYRQALKRLRANGLTP